MTTKRHPARDITPAGRLDEARLNEVLGYQLAQATIVTNAIFRHEVGSKLALSKVEYTVLMLVAENPGGSLARLARALAVTPPNITAVVDRLQARGLVERNGSAHDRRILAVSVTAAGRELVRNATERIVDAERHTLPLTVGEMAILTELLHKVARARGVRWTDES